MDSQNIMTSPKSAGQNDPCHVITQLLNGGQAKERLLSAVDLVRTYDVNNSENKIYHKCGFMTCNQSKNVSFCC